MRRLGCVRLALVVAVSVAAVSCRGGSGAGRGSQAGGDTPTNATPAPEIGAAPARPGDGRPSGGAVGQPGPSPTSTTTTGGAAAPPTASPSEPKWQVASGPSPEGVPVTSDRVGDLEWRLYVENRDRCAGLWARRGASFAGGGASCFGQGSFEGSAGQFGHANDYEGHWGAVSLDAARVELVMADGSVIPGKVGGGDLGRGCQFWAVMRHVDGRVPRWVTAYDGAGREVGRKDVSRLPW